jgi:cytochrome oxidase assembly protein ShyY1
MISLSVLISLILICLGGLGWWLSRQKKQATLIEQLGQKIKEYQVEILNLQEALKLSEKARGAIRDRSDIINDVLNGLRPKPNSK